MNFQVDCGLPEIDLYLILSWDKFADTTLILRKQKPEIL